MPRTRTMVARSLLGPAALALLCLAPLAGPAAAQGFQGPQGPQDRQNRWDWNGGRDDDRRAYDLAGPGVGLLVPELRDTRRGKAFVLRLTGNNLLDSCSQQLEQDFAGDDAATMMANNRAYNVDFMELERECSSPRWSLTLRAVF